MASASHKRDVERFDRWAATYDRSWTQRIFFGPVYRGSLVLAAELAPAPARVLDVGCGTGTLLRAAALRFPGAELVGVDASAEMVRAAAAANPLPGRIRFIRARAEELPFSDGLFDLVLSTISFHHWGDQGKGLREVARTLAPGGSFLLADHFVLPLHRAFFATRGRRQRFHTRTEIDSMLRDVGLDECEWRDIHRMGPLLLVAGVAARKN